MLTNLPSNDPGMTPMRPANTILSTLSEKSDEGSYMTIPCPDVGSAPSQETSSGIDIHPDGLESASSSDLVADVRKAHCIVPKVVSERQAQEELKQEAAKISPVLQPHMLQKTGGSTEIKNLIQTKRGNLSSRAPKLTVKCQPPSGSKSTEVSPRAKRVNHDNDDPSPNARLGTPFATSRSASMPVSVVKCESQSTGDLEGGRILPHITPVPVSSHLSQEAQEMLRKIESSASMGKPSTSRWGSVRDMLKTSRSQRDAKEGSRGTVCSFKAIRPLHTASSSEEIISPKDEIPATLVGRRMSSDDICSDDEDAATVAVGEDDKLGLDGVVPNQLTRDPISPSPPASVAGDGTSYGPRSLRSFFCSTPKTGMRRLSSTPSLTRKDSGHGSQSDLLKSSDASKGVKSTTPKNDMNHNGGESEETATGEIAESLETPCYVRLSLAESAQGPAVHVLSEGKKRGSWKAESVTVLPAKNARRKVKNSVGAAISSCTFEILNKKRSPIIGGVWCIDVTSKDVRFGTGDICMIRRIKDTHRIVMNLSAKEDSSRLVHFMFTIEDITREDPRSSLSPAPPSASSSHRHSLPSQPTEDARPSPSWERRRTSEPTQSSAQQSLLSLLAQAEPAKHGHYKAVTPL